MHIPSGQFNCTLTLLQLSEVDTPTGTKKTYLTLGKTKASRRVHKGTLTNENGAEVLNTRTTFALRYRAKYLTATHIEHNNQRYRINVPDDYLCLHKYLLLEVAANDVSN
jgi:hypothetical protein